MAISLIAYVATFSVQLQFQRRYFITLLQSNYFDTTFTFLEHLFLQRSCFFEELCFQNNHFFAAVNFSEQLLFQCETSTEQPLPENRKSFRAVTFRNSYLFDRGIVQNKDIYRGATFSKQVLLQFQKSYILDKSCFSEKRCSALPTSSGELTFQSGYFFKRRYLLQQLPFQKS